MQINKKSSLVLATTGALLLAACGGSDSASDADPCDAAATVADALNAGESSQTAEEAIEALSDFADALEDFADVAPDELKDDAELLAEGTRVLADADPENPSEEVLAIVDGDEYDNAGEAFEDYAQGTCGLEF